MVLPPNDEMIQPGNNFPHKFGVKSEEFWSCAEELETSVTSLMFKRKSHISVGFPQLRKGFYFAVLWKKAMEMISVMWGMFEMIIQKWTK